MTDNLSTSPVGTSAASEPKAPTTMSGASVPAADRPLTAGDVHLLREGDVLRCINPNTIAHVRGREYVFDKRTQNASGSGNDIVLKGDLLSTWSGIFTFVRRPAASTGDDWTEWHGGENPVPGQRADVKYRGSEHEGHITVDADARDWSHDRDHPSSDIISYRLSRPAASDEGVEPVAYRWMWPGTNQWHYADYNLHPDAETVQPLYAALASPPVSERERELEGAVARFLAVNDEFDRRASLGMAGYIPALAGVKEKSAADLRTEGQQAVSDMRRLLTAQPAGEGK